MFPRSWKAWRDRPASEPVAPRPGYFLPRSLFLRLLGCVYLAAFASMWSQADGLIGPRGILPASAYLAAARAHAGAEAYYLVPTLFWLQPREPFIDELCGWGIVLSGLLILGMWPDLVVFLLWACYLSVVVVGEPFFNYQWDSLLLETGFLAVFLAPLQLWRGLGREDPPSRMVLWLFRWLLFRLMLASGLCKLLSGDPAWRDLTALHYHYETQPLPTWTSWYVHQMPGWFQQASVVFLFVVELALPVLFFGPRRGRLVAAAGTVALQVLILATGNYGFFNLLTIALCVLLLDDDCFPGRLRTRFLPEPAPTPSRWWGWANRTRTTAAAGLLLVSLVPFLANVGLLEVLPGGMLRAYRIVAGFRSVNSYGLFAVMTTSRPEIVIEGSDDGETWRPYEFRWKPGDVTRSPEFATPHLPRLDWQMWFAALGRPQENPWLYRFLAHLHRGTPEVLALLERNPFPDGPPRHLRAVVYEYHFTDAATRRENGRVVAAGMEGALLSGSFAAGRAVRGVVDDPGDAGDNPPVCLPYPRENCPCPLPYRVRPVSGPFG